MDKRFPGIVHSFFGPVGAASFPTPTVESPSILEAPLCAMASSVQSAKQAFDKLLGALPTTLATVIIRARAYHCLTCYVGMKTLVYLYLVNRVHVSREDRYRRRIPYKDDYV